MAEQTTAFFSDEAGKQQARIAELDKKLSDYKEKHKDSLPELAQLNLQVSDRTELELHDAENRIAAYDSQEVLLRAQLAQINPTSQVYSDTGQRVMGVDDRLKSLRSQLADYKARYASGHPDIVNTEREIAGLEKESTASNSGSGETARRLSEAQAQLGRAREKYTADHPDVVRLTHLVAELEKELSRTTAGCRSENPRPCRQSGVHPSQKDSWTRLNVERATAMAKRDELRAKLNDFEGRLAQAPAVERAYRELARDLESAQAEISAIAQQTGRRAGFATPRNRAQGRAFYHDRAAIAA